MVGTPTIARLAVLVAVLLFGASMAAPAKGAEKVWRIGYLWPGHPGGPLTGVFETAMTQLGYVEGEESCRGAPLPS